MFLFERAVKCTNKEEIITSAIIIVDCSSPVLVSSISVWPAQSSSIPVPQLASGIEVDRTEFIDKW